MPKKLPLSLFVLIVLMTTGLRAQSLGLSVFFMIMDLANNKSVPIEVVTPVAVRLNGKYWEALFMRGFAKQKAGDHAGAAQDYSKVMALKPELDYLLLFRGAAHQDGGNAERACQDFEAAARKSIEGADKFLKKYCGR